MKNKDELKKSSRARAPHPLVGPGSFCLFAGWLDPLDREVRQRLLEVTKQCTNKDHYQSCRMLAALR